MCKYLTDDASLWTSGINLITTRWSKPLEIVLRKCLEIVSQNDSTCEQVRFVWIGRFASEYDEGNSLELLQRYYFPHQFGSTKIKELLVAIHNGHDDDIASNLIYNLIPVERLVLQRCGRICLEVILQKQPTMESLTEYSDVYSYYTLNGGNPHIIQNSSIKNIVISSNRIIYNLLTVCAKICPNLESVGISNNWMTPDRLAAIDLQGFCRVAHESKLKLLELIRLTIDRYLTNLRIPGLWPKDMTTLKLYGISWSDFGLVSRSLEKLEGLCISDKMDIDEFFNYYNVGASLKRLEVSHDKKEILNISIWERCPKLEVLLLPGSKVVGDKVMTVLENCPKLETIRLHSETSEEVILALAKKESLKRIGYHGHLSRSCRDELLRAGVEVDIFRA